MSHEKIAKIILGIIKKTAQGQIDWETTERSEVFQYSFTNYSIRLSMTDTELGEDYWFTIINDEGATIERVSDVDLQHDIPGSYNEMKDLFVSARRVALGVDRALDDLLDIINRDELI